MNGDPDRGAWGSLDESDLQALLRDADEITDVAVVRRLVRLLIEGDGHLAGEIEAALGKILARAITEADAEGHVWTPLIDAIATFYRLTESLDMPARRTTMIAWIEQQTGTENLWPLTHSNCHAVRTSAMRRLFVLEPEEVSRLLRVDPGSWFELYRSNDRSDSHHRALQEWAVGMILTDMSAPRSYAAARSKRAFFAIDLIHAMALDGTITLLALAEVIAAAVPRWSASAQPTQHRSQARRSTPVRHHWAELMLLWIAKWLPPSLVEAVYDVRYRGRAGDDWLAGAVQNPRASLRFLRRVARALRPSARDTWRAIVELPVLMNDITLFRIVVARAPASLATDFLTNPTRRQWPSLVHRFSAIDPCLSSLHAALLRAEQSDLRGIRREHLASLLYDGDPDWTLVWQWLWRDAILSLIPNARHSRRVRRRLVLSDNPAVLYGLCLDASGGEAVRLFDRLDAKDPRLAERAILWSSTLATILPRTRMTSVLQTADSTRRERVIGLMCCLKPDRQGALGRAQPTKSDGVA